MNSDDLGRKGEGRFAEICADAHLICNPSTVDRTGWDFVVEFPFDPTTTAHQSLDFRKTPASCHVQVKTLLDKNDRFSMRLTSAERLAKELNPAFVYVFKVSAATSEITGAYLIHLLDSPLATILKRLRKESALKTVAPNRRAITISCSNSGTALPATGNALRDALIAHIGPVPSTYVSRKADQLEKLGFEGKCFQTSMTLNASMGDLVDALLGLKTQLPASDLRSSTTRFGIKLPISEGSNGDGLVSFKPHPADTCSIVVRAGATSLGTAFEGTMYLPAIPNLPRDHLKILFRTELFTLALTQGGCKIETASGIQSQTPSSWLAYWRLLKILSDGAGVVEITCHKRPYRNTLQISRRLDGVKGNECQFWIDLWDRLAALLRFVGLGREPEMTLEAAYRERQRISFFYRLAHPDKGAPCLSFATELPRATSENLDADALCMDYLPLGEVSLAYYGTTTLRAKVDTDRIKWRTDDIQLRRMIYTRSLEKEYDNFISEAEKATKCKAVCINHLSGDWRNRAA